MNKVMLINKTNPQDSTKERKSIFFVIGDMNLSSIENKLIDVLKNISIVESKDIVLKYNGVELKLLIQQIPIVINTLCQENFSIYSVYEAYDPNL